MLNKIFKKINKSIDQEPLESDVAFDYLNRDDWSAEDPAGTRKAKRW